MPTDAILAFSTTLGRTVRRAGVVVALATVAAVGGAQDTTVAPVMPAAPAAQARDTTIRGGTVIARRPEVTRAELDAMVRAAEQAAVAGRPEDRELRMAEAAALRARLRDGDFQPGDRMILMIGGGERAFNDTVTVGAGQTISLEGYPDIPLHGVLRSELREHLTRELSRYLRAPVVRTRPLVRVTVLGGVARPGFYVVPTDLAITDLLMEAGGPAPGMDLDKSVIRRADAVVRPAGDFKAAVQQGTSLDQLGLHNGDVIDVAVKKPRSLASVTQIIGVAGSIIGLIVTILVARSR